jgi:hypothetical protein
LIPKIRHVSDRHPSDSKWLIVSLAEPAGEFPQVIEDSFAGVLGVVVCGQELTDQGRLFLADRDTLENIIAAILHGLFPRIGHECDTVDVKLGR